MSDSHVSHHVIANRDSILISDQVSSAYKVVFILHIRHKLYVSYRIKLHDF